MAGTTAQSEDMSFSIICSHFPPLMHIVGEARVRLLKILASSHLHINLRPSSSCPLVVDTSILNGACSVYKPIHIACRNTHTYSPLIVDFHKHPCNHCFYYVHNQSKYPTLKISVKISVQNAFFIVSNTGKSL